MSEPKHTDEEKNIDPALKDVDAGSDADATPVPQVGEKPSSPNSEESEAPPPKRN